MSDLERSNADRDLPLAHVAYCGYCGAPLDPNYYFCISCATPYQSEEMVITPSRPMVLTESDLIKRKAPSVWPMFWTYLGVLVGSAVIGMLLFEEKRPDLLLLFQIVSLLITTCIFAVRHWPSLWAQFKHFGFLDWPAWAALGALPPLLGINYVYHGFLMRLVQDRSDSLMDLIREAGFTRNAVILMICVFPAITEEIAFRGLLQHWLQIAVRPSCAILFSAAMFTVMHFSVLSAPYLFTLGLLLGWVKWRTNSLYPSMLIHFLHNLAVVLFFWGLN